jgi:hypothetical protein
MMASIYRYSRGLEGVYRVSKPKALDEARQASIDFPGIVVTVEEYEIITRSRLETIERCLNGDAWGERGEVVAAFRNGRKIESWTSGPADQIPAFITQGLSWPKRRRRVPRG